MPTISKNVNNLGKDTECHLGKHVTTCMMKAAVVYKSTKSSAGTLVVYIRGGWAFGSLFSRQGLVTYSATCTVCL